MVISGTIENNAVILNQKVSFPNGTKVKIRILEDSEEQSSGLCGIWEDDRPAEKIVEEIISSRTQGRETTL